ncbi:MAG: AAA family ATPase, partial [Alphaproteobacteria bacterium]|nr:AAA family ATPase [Alphaproteobacteria bacterium]
MLERIAAALERLAPPAPPAPGFETADAFVWQAAPGVFQPVVKVN